VGKTKKSVLAGPRQTERFGMNLPGGRPERIRGELPGSNDQNPWQQPQFSAVLADSARRKQEILQVTFLVGEELVMLGGTLEQLRAELENPWRQLACSPDLEHLARQADDEDEGDEEEDDEEDDAEDDEDLDEDLEDEDLDDFDDEEFDDEDFDDEDFDDEDFDDEDFDEEDDDLDEDDDDDEEELEDEE
jgi:hypothetical protein